MTLSSSRSRSAQPGNSRRRGFSMVEALISVSVAGIISSVAVFSYGKVTTNSKNAIAQNLVETLNQGARKFSHANWDLRYTADAGSAADEMFVLRSLQWSESDTIATGSDFFMNGPYVRTDWSPTTSSDDDDWRIQWTGSSWKLLKPDQAGTGLKVAFDASDTGTPYVFPDGFQPVSSH